MSEEKIILSRSFIDSNGTFRQWYQINNTNHEGCQCAVLGSMAPCSFCVDTCECDICGHRYESQYITETQRGFECPDCLIGEPPLF